MITLTPFSSMFLISQLYFTLLLLVTLIICSQRFTLSALSIISFLPPLIAILLLSALTGKLLLAVSISCSFVIILQLFNQLKNHYYKERLFFPDIKVMFDPRNFETLYRYPMALLAVVGLLLFLVINTWLYYDTLRLNTVIRLIALGCATLFTMFLYLVAKKSVVMQQWESLLPKGTTTITNLYLSALKINYQPPFYSIDSLLFTTSQKIINPLPTTKADIIMILQESTLNPLIFQPPTGVNLPSYDMFTLPEKNKQYGSLRVQTFGGATWLSEFSALTGLNSDDFLYRKNCVFYTVAPHIQYSIFNELKSNGYFTVVLTPMHPLNYNAGPTYKTLGVDLILQPQDLGYPAPVHTNLWNIPSANLLNYAKKILTHYTDKPLFIFMLTMAEHGPYNSNYPDELGLHKHNIKLTDAAEINDYLNRLALLDSSIQDFKSYLLNRNRPTLLNYFGDHQPSIRWNMPYHPSCVDATHLTQFVLWDNFSHNTEITIAEETDISFLPGMILEKLNLDISPFFKANIQLRHLTKGKLDYYHDEQLIHSYKNYIYQKIKQAG